MALLLALAGPAWAQPTPPHDTVPASVLCPAPTIQSVASGRWSDPATWTPFRLPLLGDRVRVSAGHTVTLDVAYAGALRCVDLAGTVAADPTVDTRLWAGEVAVPTGGHLQIGTAAQPIPAGRLAEVVIADQPLDLAADPEQYGTGLLVWGRLTVHGAPLNRTWLRLAVEPQAGATTLTVEAPVTGWRAGDRLIVPDTRHMHDALVGPEWGPQTKGPEWEERTLASVSADGRTLTLTAPLAFGHPGSRWGDGTVAFLPHVGNLSRSVVIRSENPAGTRGHVFLTGRAEVDLRYAAFRDLGRTTNAPLDPVTNHIGRYPLHLHYLLGPATPSGPQYTLIGNAIDGGSAVHRVKWGLAVHASHYGLIQDTVLYNWAGAALAFEDGSETGNVVDRNFSVRTVGTGGRQELEGTEGTAFWFRGANTRVTRNVAANAWGDQPDAAYGYKFLTLYLGWLAVPATPGADPSQYVGVHGNQLPIPEFRDNEVYSTAQGLTYWWIDAQGRDMYPAAQETVFRDTRLWHVYNKAIFHYPAARITFDGLEIANKAGACCNAGVVLGDYATTAFTMRRFRIEGTDLGLFPSTISATPQVFEDGVLRNVTNVQTSTLFSTDGAAGIPPRDLVLRRVRMEPWTDQWRPFKAHIEKLWNLQPGHPGFAPTVRDDLLVEDAQGQAGDTFRVYYPEQATQAVAGGLAPCTATRAGIVGLVCGTGPAPPPVLYPLTLTKTGAGTGRVMGAGDYLAGTVVTLTAVAATGSTFNGWSPVPCGSTVTMPAGPLACVATFGTPAIPPRAPVTPSAGAVSVRALTYTWPVPPADVAAVVLERRVGTGAWGLLAEVPPTPSVYEDRAMSAGVSHCYRHRAKNEAGVSAATAQKCRTP